MNSLLGVSQGSGQFMGDADFFINNADIQPGCKEVKHHSILKLGRQELLPGQILPGCSHKRAFKYFIESIENRDCVFVGIQCPDYTNFLDVSGKKQKRTRKEEILTKTIRVL